MIEEIDYENKCKEILAELQQQDKSISMLKEEINRLKLSRSKSSKEILEQPNTREVLEEITDEESFEDEINFYLNNFRLLSEDFKEEEIKSILPRKKNQKYKDILLRLSLESIKEIKEVKDIMRTEDLSSEESNLCNKIIEAEKRKIDYIKSKLIVNKDNTADDANDIEEKNNIILVPTLAGNIRLIDELEHIPNDYYDGFKELIGSIIDGTFKNVRVFANNSPLVGITEVKSFKIRVVFTRLSTDTYALITAFVKKSDNDKLYKESLACKIREYHLIEAKLKEKINDQDFLEENEKSVNELWNILSPKEDSKKKAMIL